MDLDTLFNAYDAGHVVRYHTAHTIGNPTLSEHVYGVLIVLDYLTEGTTSPTLMRAALYHDYAERFTGDLPHTFKARAPEIRAALAGYEEEHTAPLGLAELSGGQEATLKCADILEMGIYAHHQFTLGNRHILPILTRVDVVAKETIRHLRTYNCHNVADRAGDLLNRINLGAKHV